MCMKKILTGMHVFVAIFRKRERANVVVQVLALAATVYVYNS